MNILFSIALLAICYLIVQVLGGQLIDTLILYLLLLINDKR